MSIAGYLGYELKNGKKTVYLPGETSHGHYQIELKCESCHTETDVVSASACLACHEDELDRADDSHPMSKFNDPRNAALLEKLDAQSCSTCHVEHRPMLTASMGVTLPEDYCFHCHADVGDDRPSHAGVDHATCQSAGCHNFHDNLGLHEDYLEQHLGEPALLTSAVRLVPAREPSAEALGADAADAPEVHRTQAAVEEWAKSAHAAAGVNCSGCHGSAEAFVAKPAYDSCAGCHEKERTGFEGGHHGMRLAAGLGPMRPGLARLPMKKEAADAELGCTSCHGAHAESARFSQVESCLGCHADEHSLAFEGSAHAAKFAAELAGGAPLGSGVSCATCHMPALPVAPGAREVFVQHNQNDNLRPNEKMVRGVCTSCHGLGFTLDALADEGLVKRNFHGKPGVHVKSLDWVGARMSARAASKQQR